MVGLRTSELSLSRGSMRNLRGHRVVALFKNAHKIIKSLEPYAPVPIAAAVCGLGGFPALALGASSFSVLLLSILIVGSTIYAQERRIVLRRKELELQFDKELREDGKVITERLETRLRRSRKSKEPSLFEGRTDE
jgi:hypothetical protein